MSEPAKYCPRCGEGKIEGSRYSVSRRDNSTRICADCGIEEAFVDAGLAMTREQVEREAAFRGRVR